MKVIHLGGNGKKNSEEDLNKIEVRFSERKQKMNDLKINLIKMLRC